MALLLLNYRKGSLEHQIPGITLSHTTILQQTTLNIFCQKLENPLN